MFGLHNLLEKVDNTYPDFCYEQEIGYRISAAEMSCESHDKTVLTHQQQRLMFQYVSTG